MDKLWIVVVVGAVIALVAVWLLSRTRAQPNATDMAASDRVDTLVGWPPTATRILTTAERLAYTTLARAMPGYMVLAQVPLARFLKVPMRHSYSEWLRRLGHQCADLVVCDMASQVIAVVHIQPASGERSERARRRFARMQRVLRAAKIPLHTWVEGNLPSPEEAREVLVPVQEEALSPTSANAFRVTEPPPMEDTSPSPIDDLLRDSGPDELIEMREPPLSTWFDEFDSAPTPLDPNKPGAPGQPGKRPPPGPPRR
jgi:hypothetical protein